MGFLLAALTACDLDRRLLYFPDTSRPILAATGLRGAREVRLATEDGLSS